MNYLVTKSTTRNQYRIYIDDQTDKEGSIIYKGHKLGVEEDILGEILDIRVERSGGNFIVLNYNKVETEPDHTDMKMWIIGRSESLKNKLFESYESLQNKMKSKFGEFRKIIITKVNI
jgi:hypothetical protein